MRVETHRTIIVPSAVVEQCRALAARFPGGQGMFTTRLYAMSGKPLRDIDGYVLPDYYISSGKIDQSVADALDDPASFAAQVGAGVEEVTVLRAAMHVSTRTDVHAELAELNMSLTPTMEDA
jgi:hypothetical protein